MIWLEVRYQPQVVNGPEGVRYAVRAEVLSSGGIEREAFVFRTTDDAYMHPALPFDMNTYPAGKAQALASHADFYRERTVERSYPSSHHAAEAVRIFKSRLKVLVRQWQALQTEPIGDETVEVYTSE